MQVKENEERTYGKGLLGLLVRNSLLANIIFFVGVSLAMLSHWYAKFDNEIRFTILGWFSATLASVYYGLSFNLATNSITNPTNDEASNDY